MFTKNIGEDAGQTGCGRATDSFWVFMLKKKILSVGLVGVSGLLSNTFLKFYLT